MSRVTGVNTFGEPVLVHEELIRREVSYLEALSSALDKHLDLNDHGPVEAIVFLVAHINHYCPASALDTKHLIPGEFAILPFSLHEGIMKDDGKWGLILSEGGPLEYMSEVAEARKTLKLAPLRADDEQKSVRAKCEHLEMFCNNAATAFETFERVIDKAPFRYASKTWIFVRREDAPLIDRCLRYMKAAATGGVSDDHGIGLIPLSMLCKKLMDRTKIVNTTIFLPLPNEGAAERLLERPQYEGDVELGCQWHIHLTAQQENDNEQKRKFHKDPDTTVEVTDGCSLAVVQRLLYNFLKYYRGARSLPLYQPGFAPFLDIVAMEVATINLSEDDRAPPMPQPQNDEENRAEFSRSPDNSNDD